MGLAIPPPDQVGLLAPLLTALPAAAAAAEPAVKLLPLLSPILRQRVQLLSGPSSEPWLRLLCYDTAKAARLAEIVRGPLLEPHPVSGDVEVDWDNDAQTEYRRLDCETLQALVVLSELCVAFRLVYCVGDQEGGGDGWRVGEVTVADTPHFFSDFDGASSISGAERRFQLAQFHGETNGQGETTSTSPKQDEGLDDDDEYWGRYDATPARTPAGNRSPAAGPASKSHLADRWDTSRLAAAEDEYFAQYDQVQPAMDNHDPDEEAQAAQLAPPLGLGQHGLARNLQLSGAQSSAALGHGTDAAAADILQPRPDSSASSNGSGTIARLEKTAGKQAQNEFGVKKHVSHSIKSLYMLARASGIAREDFARLVTTELEALGVMDEDD